MGTVSVSRPNQSLRDRLVKRGDFLRLMVYAFSLLVTIGGAFVIGRGEYGTIVLAGVLGFGVMLAVIVRPHYGMYLLVIFVYTNLSTLLMEAFNIPSMNKILVGLIFVSVIATQIVMKRKPLVFRLSEATMLLYIMVTSVSTILSSGANINSVDSILDVVKDFVIVFIIVQLANEESVWRRAQWLLIISATVLSVLTWYQFFTDDYTNTFYGLATSRIDYVDDSFGDDIDIQRVGGPVGDPNYYAQILVMVFPLALYRMISQKATNRRLFAALCLVIITGAIVFTYSRTTLIVLIMVTGLILLERRINIYKIMVAGILGIVVVLPILPTGYTERMLTIIGVVDTAPEQQEDVSARGRLSEAIAAFQMFQDYPIMGIGYGAYEFNYQSYSAKLGLDDRTEDRHAHNLYLEILGETGIIGMASFVFMIVVVFQSMNRARKQFIQVGRADLIPWLLALQFGLIAYLLNSIFLHDDYARYFRLALAMAVSATALAESLLAKHEAEHRRKRMYGEENLMLEKAN